MKPETKKETKKQAAFGCFLYLVGFLALSFGVTCLVQWGTGGMNGDEHAVFWFDWKFFCLVWPFCTLLTAIALMVLLESLN